MSTDGFTKHPVHLRESVPIRGFKFRQAERRVSVRSLRRLFQRPLKRNWRLLDELSEIQAESYRQVVLRKMVRLARVDVSCRLQSGLRSGNTFGFVPPIPSEPTAAAAWFTPVAKTSHWQGRQRSGELSIPTKD
jgi:hypothetical protein